MMVEIQQCRTRDFELIREHIKAERFHIDIDRRTRFDISVEIDQAFKAALVD